MDLLQALMARGVKVLAPSTVVVRDLDPRRVEGGVEIHPGVVLEGERTLLRAGTRLGVGGGGLYSDICTGRDVTLGSGRYERAVFLDRAQIRGYGEVREGTLLEEEAEGAHCVGFKMTILFPFVVAGSLVNFCDVLVAGGTSRKDHSEIGSCLALYNFTPWGDKYASLLGDVPRGVFLRERRIFVGGQVQMVSPVQVGYGSLIPAGAAIRSDVGEGRIKAEAPVALDRPFDGQRLGRLLPKVKATVRHYANLQALALWYKHVRPLGARDELDGELYRAAGEEVRRGIQERLRRLDAVMGRLEGSMASLQGELATGADARLQARLQEQALLAGLWPALRSHLVEGPPREMSVEGEGFIQAMGRARQRLPQGSYIDLIRSLSPEDVALGQAWLGGVVDSVEEKALCLLEGTAPDECLPHAPAS